MIKFKKGQLVKMRDVRFGYKWAVYELKEDLYSRDLATIEPLYTPNTTSRQVVVAPHEIEIAGDRYIVNMLASLIKEEFINNLREIC